MPETIFNAVDIKGLHLKNRIYATPMVTRFSKPSTGMAEPEAAERYGRLAQGARALSFRRRHVSRQSVGAHVFAANGITSPEMAQAVLSRTKAAMVGK